MNKKIASLLVLLAGSLWGFMGLLVRSLSGEGLSSMDICFVRAAVTLVVMLVGLLLFKREVLKVRIKDLWCFVGTGAFSITFFNFCYFKTMTLTSLSVAAVMLYTAPAFVMLLSAVLFKERMSVRKGLALLLAFAGCVFVSGIIGGGSALTVSGMLFGIGAGLGYALYSIFGRYALEKGYGSATISFYTFVFATLSSVFFADLPEIGAVMGSSLGLSVKTVVLVLMVTLIPYLCYTKGLNGLENGTASVIASVEPVVATLVGVLIYQEKMDLWNVVGIALVLGSILLLNMGGKENGKE